jgi:hypothetical protein
MGFIHTACNISLLTEVRYKISYSFLISLGVFILFRWSTMLNIQDVDYFLEDFSTLSSTCVFQVSEGLMLMFVSLLLIRSHYQTLTSSWFQKVASYIALAPSGIFLAGLFLVQTYAFNVIEDTPFYQIALGLAIVGFLILMIVSTAIASLIRSWESRMDIKIVLSFLQVLLAMFLPIIVTGNKLQESHFVFELSQAILIITILLSVTVLGLYWHRFRQRRMKF